MNTLCVDLLNLINNYLDVVQESLIDSTKEHIDLNPSTNIKVWLHFFKHKGAALQILYKNNDVKTLIFIRTHYRTHEYERLCREYLEFIEIKEGRLKRIEHRNSSYRRHYRKIIKYACQHNELDTIKRLDQDGYYTYGELAPLTYKYAYRFGCIDIIDYMRNRRSSKTVPIDSVIKSRGSGGFDLVYQKFSEEHIHDKLVIILMCFKYQHLELASYLLKDYDGHSLYDKLTAFIKKNRGKCSGLYGDREKINLRWIFIHTMNHDHDFAFSIFNSTDLQVEAGTFLYQAINNGATDATVSAILQKYPSEGRGLPFQALLDCNKLSITCESIDNIKRYRGEISEFNLNILQRLFLKHGRYDLLKFIGN